MILTPYMAYQQVLEAEDKKVREIKNNKIIKPSRIARPAEDRSIPADVNGKEYTVKPQKEDKMNEIIHASQNGNPVDHKARKYIREKDLNSKYRAKFVSPFYKETSRRANAQSGIFSSDENAVAAALSNEVPTNKPVQSKLLNIGDYYTLGITTPKDGMINIGMVDALTLHCWTGNYNVVKLILRNGYDTPRSYPGLNPITAAIDGKNIEVLKMVLSVPKIEEFINKKDGNGNYPLEAVAKIKGIDPYEFAKILIEKGARDDVRTDKSYSAAMLTLMNGNWTPNLFGELLAVTDIEKKTREGMTLREMAFSLGNREAVIMIDNFIKFNEESINQSVTHSALISR